MAISFGVTVLPDPPFARFLELLQLAEPLEGGAARRAPGGPEFDEDDAA